MRFVLSCNKICNRGSLGNVGKCQMNENNFLTEMIIFKQGFVIKNVQNTRTFNLSNCSNTYKQKKHENQKLRLGLER
jgi:hypothetical protein